jgi:hypothetical protein
MDKRELILVRLLEVLSTIDGINAFRNKTILSAIQKPAILLFDSDEKVDQDDFERKRPPAGKFRVSMQPEIYVLLSSSPDSVGQELNQMRARVIKAVLTDTQLKTLCHDGDMRYGGCATGLASGRSMEGEAGLSFIFNYILQPDLL